MKLFIKVSDKNQIKFLYKLLNSDLDEIKKQFNEEFFWEIKENINPQYEIFLKSYQTIKDFYQAKLNNKKLIDLIEWFYVWTEQCEFLALSKEEYKNIKSEIFNFFWNRKKIVLVIPYYWNKIIEHRIKELIEEYIKDKEIVQKEIVINNLWIKEYIEKKSKEYKRRVKIIFWTLLIKHFKAPIFEQYESNALMLPEEYLNSEEREKKYKEMLNNNLKEFNRAV